MTSVAARIVASVFAVALLLHSPRVSAQNSGATTRQIFASISDDRSSPISDLTPADLIVKEDGKTREILAVEPAAGLLQVVVIVDDDGSGVFRYGLARFAELLQGRAEISMRIIRGQAQELFGFTKDADRWMAGIRLLGVRPPTPGGGQLLEGLADAAADLKRREAQRPVIVALTTGGGEQSPLDGDRVLDGLRDSRASLHVVFAGSPLPKALANKPSELLTGDYDLTHVLGDGPKETGGIRRDVIATQAVLTVVQQIARDLVMQMAITYVRPAGNNPRSLSVSSSRRGVKVVAPTRAPVR